MITKKILFKNSIFNLLNGFSSFIFILLIPRFLLPTLGKAQYSLVALIMNLLPYLSFFAITLQTAIAKFVAQTKANNEITQLKEFLNAGFLIILVTMGICIFATFLIALILPYKILPINLLGFAKSFKLAIISFGMLTSLGLLYNVYAGYFIGTLQNYLFVIVQFIARFGAIICLGVYAWHFKANSSLQVIVMILGASYFIVFPIMFVVFHYMQRDLYFESTKIVSKAKLKEIWKFSVQLSTWSIAMLFITNMNLYLVGCFDFKHVADFSLAVIMVNVAVGVLGSITQPLMPYFSGLIAQGSPTLGRKIFKYTVNIFFISVAFMLVFILTGEKVIEFLFHYSNPHTVYKITIIMLLGFLLRNLLLPLSSFLIASSQQSLGISTVICEASANFFASILGGKYYLCNGVAWGGVFGAFVALLTVSIFILPKVRYVKKVC